MFKALSYCLAYLASIWHAIRRFLQPTPKVAVPEKIQPRLIGDEVGANKSYLKAWLEVKNRPLEERQVRLIERRHPLNNKDLKWRRERPL